MVSVEYFFASRTSHGAAAPWADRSALDAVEVMNYAWNMRRENLPLSHRSLRGNDFTPTPLATEIGPLSTPESRGEARAGYSDDVGDIMWTIPSITIGYPSNIPNTIPHHITSAMAMATPIAHKGAVAGAKAVGMTVLDLLTDPSLIVRAKDYFVNIQKAPSTYDPLLSAEDMPAIELNSKIVRRVKESMEPYNCDPTRYDSYLEHLGIEHPGI